MQAHDLNSPSADLDLAVNDLGPLAWVLDELRKSLDGSAKALKRFVREAEAAKSSDLATLDASQLRMAGQQLHQAVGALEMVGLAGPALLLRAMEAAVQRFVQQPVQCSQDAASTLESASFALTDYLEAVLADKPISAVSLFPQYRDVQALVRADRIHPADLWPLQWRWLEPELALTTEPRNYDVQARTAFDQSVLQMMKGQAPLAADTLKGLSLAFSARQAERQPRIFWKIAAAYFEALAHDLLPSDMYVRRASSRVLLQYASLSKGDLGVSERLAQDLLFFCSQAISASPVDQPVLTAVRAVYGLARFKSVDYTAVQFGRFDPALLAQARKRIASAKETWSSISAGDATKFQTVADQFGRVSDSLVKLHPSSEPLAQSLTRAIEMTVRSGQAPAIELAMEVATSVLYLEAAFEDLDPNDPQLTQRTQHLAARLDRVKNGAKAQPLESWMEDLYRRVSDKQTMGSVVGELRLSLGELEKSLDIFFRNPQDKAVLINVPGQLARMRGVLSVLGLDQASQAVSLMRSSVEQMLETDMDEEHARAAGTFDRLGNNLGALSFLIDMLNYQPALAKKLFVYDDVKGELKPLMGRAEKVQSFPPESPNAVDALSQEVISVMRQANSGASDEDLAVKLDALATHAALAGQAVLAKTAHDASVAVSTNDLDATAQALTTMADNIAPAPIAAASQVQEVYFQEDDLREIFLQEARQVTANGQEANRLLAKDPADSNQLAVLRRVFHTLKGSSRMVGFDEFGEAAWAMEQLFNGWLAEQKPASEHLLQLSAESLTGLSRWIEDMVGHHGGVWSASAFRASAEAMRMQGRYLALVLPQAVLAPAEVNSDAPPDTQSEAIANDFAAELLDLNVEPIATVFAPGLDIHQEATAGELGDADADAQFAAPSLPVLEELATPAPSLAAQIHPDDEDQVKVIGHLRIAIPLYNVYLNEADEWSRRLVNEVTEWAMERSHPVADSTVSFAHSLAGSSATVGLVPVSDMARALEHALQHSQTRYSPATAEQYAGLFIQAAEDIRRLLHQFAAGFLKKADADVLAQLRALDFSALESLSASPAAEPVTPAPVLTLHLAAVSPRAAVAGQIFAPAASSQEPSVTSFLDDDEIDAVDAIDAELFPIFDEEAAELMPQLGGALRQWSARPDNLGARMEVLRVLHTLKGSARLAGALRLGDMAHRIESEIEFLGNDAAATQDFEALLTRFDAMQNTLDVLRRADASDAAMAFTEPLPAAFTAEKMAEKMFDETTASVAGFAASSPRPVLGKGMIPAPQMMARQPLRQAAIASIRVRSQLLDRMINQAGEVMITRSRLEVELNQLRGSLGDMTDNLNRLREQLRDIEFQADTQMQSRLAQAKELQAGFDPLEFDRFTRVQELTRMMAESVNDVATVQRSLQRTVEATEDGLIAQARQTRDLQRDLLSTRMVEFESISDRLYRVVRQASKDTGKQVKLDLLGATIEMDRGMLDRMTPSFEHLLRNCVAHGIESPAVRSAAAKVAAGLIIVELRQEGNDVSVQFSDDGAGLDLERIREKAISSGLVQASQPLDDQQAANLIFMPGFTTAAQVTELSGRGIGMDVVLSEVNSVGGRIETSTVAGKGTQFKLVLPLTTAVTQVVMIRSGSLVVGVPTNLVETVRRSTAQELQQAYNTGSLDVAGDAIPFFWSGALLQSSAQSAEVQGKTTPVVIFRSAAQRVALHVDEVLGNQEVVVKNLGPQLSRLPGLAGMSVLASGAVVLIYNPVVLASMYGDQARAMSGDSAEPHMLERSGNDNLKPAHMVAAPPQMPLVLVVDDSITVRRVTQRLLQREGFRVVIAADGLQALERLQDELPAVVLSDIEMPRMDGFDLVRNIRGDARLAKLPIVMITSRIAQKHREHAKELGVDHYLGKPYAEQELISLVRHYCSLEVAV
jgi:chemosensory pili system protein ChpA (sensor histidine kinase/response regulator)